MIVKFPDLQTFKIIVCHDFIFILLFYFIYYYLWEIKKKLRNPADVMLNMMSLDIWTTWFEVPTEHSIVTVQQVFKNVGLCSEKELNLKI